MTINELKSSVVGFYKDGCMIPKRIASAPELFYSRSDRGFDGLELVDSAGLSYRCALVPNPSPTWVSRVLGILLRRGIPAELVMSEPVPVALDQLKQKMIEYIDADLEIWESGGDSDELKEGVRKARDFREAINALLPP